MSLSDHDHLMIVLAMNRGRVHVTLNGRTTTATLIAWRPHRGHRSGRANTARVRFQSGRELTVPVAQVEPLQDSTP